MLVGVEKSFSSLRGGVYAETKCERVFVCMCIGVCVVYMCICAYDVCVHA